MILTFNTLLGAVGWRRDELSEDSVEPPALTVTTLASVLTFYCCSCDLLDNTVRFTHLDSDELIGINIVYILHHSYDIIA